MKMRDCSVVVNYQGSTRVQKKMAGIQNEYRSNARLLAYFSQSNPRDFGEDSLVRLETALLRRQEMLLDQIAATQASSYDELLAKLELWAEESDEETMSPAQHRILLSVIADMRRLAV
jgi:hypothetical protein